MGPKLAAVSLVLLTLFANSLQSPPSLSTTIERSYDEGSGETDEYYEPQQQPTTEEPYTVDFDCGGLDDGNYADGCADVFYTCTNGVAFERVCPEGTVYNPNQQACDYDCTSATTTTTPSYVPTTTATPTTQSDDPKYTTTPEDDSWKTTTSGWETTTPQDDSWKTTTSGWETTTPGFDDVTTTQAPFVCQEGQVKSFGMCSSRFDRCQNNAVRSKQCPVNTLFESSLVLCVFDLPQCLPVTVPPPTPKYDSNGYISYGSPSDTIVSPFDENVRLKQKVDRRRKYHRGPIPRPGYGGNSYGNAPSYGNTVLENPFYISRPNDAYYGRNEARYGSPHLESPFFTRFHGHAALNDQFKDYRRARMGKINYESRDVTGDKRFLMDDGFDGKKARFLESDVRQIFPEARHSKRRLGPREDPDGYEDEKTFAAKDLFGATRRKRSAYYGSQQSGYGQQQQYTQITARQAQVNKDCQQYTTPTFLTFGDCFDQFIYCSGNGVNRMAACPIGETFNKALRACSETCGVVVPVATSTAATQTGDDSTWSATTTGSWSSDDDVTTFTTTAPSSFDSYTTTQSTWNDESTTTQSSWNDVPTTTSIPVGDRCASELSGLFSLGCSQKYLQCSDGAAIVRSCSGALYFSEAKQSCNFRDKVPECGSQDSPIVIVPVDDVSTDSYGTPSEDGITKAPVGDRCSYVSTGLFAIGCSQKYIQCADGAAVVRQCAASLYFNEASQSCKFRDDVKECQSVDNDSAYYAPGKDQTTTSGYGNGYGVSDDQSSTTPGYGNNYGSSDDQPATTTSGYGNNYGSSDDQPAATTSGYGNNYGPSDDQTTTSGYRGGYGPSDDQSSTTSGYGNTYEPSEDQPTTYKPSVAPYNPSVPKEQQDKPVDACAGLSDGTHGQGCSSSYIICKYQRLVSSLTCPLGEGYDPSVQNCRTFSQIPAQACDQEETTTDAGLVRPLPYQTLEDVLSTTTTTTVGYDEETTDSYITVPSDDYTTTTTASYGEEETPASDAPYGGYTTTPADDATTTVETVTDSYNRGAYDESEEEEDVSYEQKCVVGSRVSKGECIKEFLECTSNGFVEKSCRFGLFDSHSNKCVARIACGRQAIRDATKDVIGTTTASPSVLDGRCAHVAGVGTFGLAKCHDVYVLCEYGAPKLQKCSRNQVFSNVRLECVSRDSDSECNDAQNPPVKSAYNNNQGQSAFCDGKADGLYRNKRDCGAILQCFGGDLFDHASCPSNLAFNERTGKCDYPQKVSGCENHGRTEGVCTEHGSFIADVEDCKVFYRCVWGRKVVMKCPSGTVFNPLLSVCDWPKAVPSCSGPSYSGGGGSSSYGTSSSNDDNSGY